MSETPDQPRPPADDERGPQSIPAGPPLEDPADPTLPSVTEEDQARSRRPPLSRGRLAVAGVAVLVLLGAGVAVALGGDGDDGGTDGVASLDGSEGDVETAEDGGGGNSGRPDPSEMEDAMLEYVDCMREHGIDMPDPQFGEGGRVVMEGPRGNEASRDEMEAANEACQPILEDAAPDLDLSPEEVAELQDKVVAMAECMRQRGYDFPDPVVGEDGGITIALGEEGQGGGVGPAPGDEQFEQDQQECSEEAGMTGPGGGFVSGSEGEEGSA